MGSRRILLIALIAFASAIAGVFVGRLVSEQPRANETELHAVLHKKLKLTPQQHSKIDAIEARYAVRRKALEFEMRAANARLAEAIEEEHGYGPKVTAAIDHSHMVMGALQKETLEHLFAMREVLNPEQARMFDSTVVKALTADAR
ncbi:Spy/CpxP family protein refolding chaperone [Sphingorhabdus buctiana]|jgi:nickel and cobalt resistance protein CnrR|uniref:Spy/CpxP family protein refolding chaperone n=1 Tax=Sphingorhabdus buctiana TaxID=1508805 RepID=A0ABW4MFT5_9SPHN